MNASQLERGLAANRTAVNELIARAEHVGADRWLLRPTAKQWTPAQHVMHISLAYDATTRDVRDGQRVRLIGSPMQRRMWRLFGLSQVMLLGRLPRGAPSPREIRPPDVSPERTIVIADLRAALAQFDDAVRNAWRERPGHRATHPYFGAISLRQMLRLCEVHTCHHTAQLPAD